MIRVGLTGNIGSGKTIVCRVFEMLGIPVFYADMHARRLIERPELIESIGEMFGNEVLNDEGKIDRSKLAAIVFSDKEALNRLNMLIHPMVRKEFDEWVTQQEARYVIMEAAIIFETGQAEKFDKTILVVAGQETRIERVCKRDQVGREEVIRRISNQKPQDELIPLANYVIHNDDNVLVLPQILKIDLDLSRE